MTLTLSEELWHEKFPWSLPLSFNNLNSYNSTKDPLFSAQTHVRDSLIETSKGGQVEVNQEDEKREELKGAMYRVLHLEVHCRTHPERGGIRLWLTIPVSGEAK